MISLSQLCAKQSTHFITFTPVEVGSIHMLTLHMRQLRQREVKGLSQIKELVSPEAKWVLPQ